VFWYVAAPVRARRGIVTNLGATLTGILYVPFLGSYALLLLRAPEAVGRNLLLVVVGLTVLYDISAYGIGSLWGSRPLAPTVSPRKSWEGVIGATFILLLFALALIPLVTPFADPAGADSGGLGAGAAVGLALVIAVAAPLGDLAESALKRDLGVKDMGTLLPGHGGILDRIDSILFAAPAAWYFMRIVLL
jgi:phosphatidate cytidylyltransferase